MIFSAVCRGFFFTTGFLLAWPAVLPAQEPFRFPTANHFLFEPGKELEFFAPTAPDKPWTSGSFGCVRDNGQRIHEGLDIRCLQRDKRGEPTDPVMATADGTVVYFNTRPALSNFGNYVVLRHFIDGMEIYSLYGHLRQVRPGLKIGQTVKAGDVIGTMGRTSNTAERIAPWRAHVHYQLNLLVNDRFAAWFKTASPRQRNDHGEWNGQNLDALDARQILLAEHAQGDKFNLLNFIRGQTRTLPCGRARHEFSFFETLSHARGAQPGGSQGRCGRL